MTFFKKNPLLLLLFLVACGTVGITGRRQLLLMSEGEEVQLGLSTYKQAMGQYPEIRTGPQIAMLKRVLSRIAPVTGKKYPWEVRLLKADNVVNAWCLPGGKIAFYTGILRIARTEDEVAAVMGHEIAHAYAHHGNERMSQNMGLKAVAEILSLTLSGSGQKGQQMRSNVMLAFGVASKVGLMLPFSRKQESEADEIGLHFMVKAGYDPQAAVRLWERMAKGRAPSSGLDRFLSTHPQPLDRARALQRLIPKVRAKYGR